MLKKLKVAGLVLIGALAFMGPSKALAERHHDRDYYAHVRWERHEYWRHHHHWRAYYGGYYDRWGYWHPYYYR
jgi:hypothetical protein